MSQVVMRKRLKERGYDPETSASRPEVNRHLLWLPVAAAIVQTVCLVMLVIEDQLVFAIATAAVVVPMIVRYINVKRGTARDVVMLDQGSPSMIFSCHLTNKDPVLH